MTLEEVFQEDMIHETNLKAIVEDFSLIDIISGDATNPDKEA